MSLSPCFCDPDDGEGISSPNTGTDTPSTIEVASGNKWRDISLQTPGRRYLTRKGAECVVVLHAPRHACVVTDLGPDTFADYAVPGKSVVAVPSGDHHMIVYYCRRAGLHCPVCGAGFGTLGGCREHYGAPPGPETDAVELRLSENGSGRVVLLAFKLVPPRPESSRFKRFLHESQAAGKPRFEMLPRATPAALSASLRRVEEETARRKQGVALIVRSMLMPEFRAGAITKEQFKAKARRIVAVAVTEWPNDPPEISARRAFESARTEK